MATSEWGHDPTATAAAAAAAEPGVGAGGGGGAGGGAGVRGPLGRGRAGDGEDVGGHEQSVWSQRPEHAAYSVSAVQEHL